MVIFTIIIGNSVETANPIASPLSEIPGPLDAVIAIFQGPVELDIQLLEITDSNDPIYKASIKLKPIRFIIIFVDLSPLIFFYIYFWKNYGQ